MRQKNLLFTWILSVIFLCSFIPAQGQDILASWSFDDLKVAPNTSTVIEADFGEQQGTAKLYLDGTNGSSSWISATSGNQLTSQAGNTINDPRPVTKAGQALAILNGTNGSANNQSIVFVLSTTDYKDISITYVTRKSNTGFNTHSWSWSTDNSTYTAFGDNTAPTNETYTLKTLDLSSITGVNNATDLYLKLTVSGGNTSSNAGNNRIDNFVIKGTTSVSDITPPVWTAEYPKTANITKTTVDLTVNMNEPGKAYYLALTDDSAEPSSEDIVTAGNEITVAAANTDYTKTIEGLENGTVYDLYVVAQDISNNLQTTPTTLKVTTLSQSDEAEITAYTLPEQIGNTVITNGAITVMMPSNTDKTNLIATFTLSEGATAKVGETDQVSGTTTNNFTNPVTYVVAAEDGTTKNWIVTIIHPSTDATITSTVYTVNNELSTITNIPFSTTLDAFKANLTPAENAAFEVYQANGETIATDLATGYKVIVTAQDGITKKEYEITLNEEPTGDLFISEYVEGSSNNKAIEIYNGTGTSIDLSIYTIKVAANGGEWTTTNILSLSGVLENGEVYVVANTGVSEAIKAVADQLSNNGTNFNGNDAVGLFKNNVLIDVVGKQGEDPGDKIGWTVAGIEKATYDHTLIRKPAVKQGNTDWTVSAGTSEENSEWLVYPMDFIAGLGSHNHPLPSSDANIISFNVGADQIGDAVIDMENHTVSIGVKASTDRSALTPIITISEGATIDPATGVEQDFTSAVTYTVTAAAGNTQTWNVTVSNYSNVATLSDLKVDGISVENFDPATFEYEVELPYGSTAVPVVTYTKTSDVSTDEITNAVDLTQNTTVKVISQDKSVENRYTISFIISEEPLTGKDFLTFSHPDQTGNAVINSTAGTITLEVEGTADLTNLIVTFTLSRGATAKVGDVDQVSGVTPNNFTNPVVYTVTAQDGTLKSWTVNITKETTGIDHNETLDLMVYPNPFADIIYFNNAEIEVIKITNLSGQQIFSIPAANINSFDTSRLTSGIYLITFQDNAGNNITKRMIKE